MAGRTKKITPADEKKIVASVRAGVPVAVLAKTYDVTRPTIYRAIRSFHDKAKVSDTNTAPVSFTVNRDSLLAFDAFTGRLGLKSRADALRRVAFGGCGFDGGVFRFQRLADGGGVEAPFGSIPGDALEAHDVLAAILPVAGLGAARYDEALRLPEPER